jgi:hypothetical protein
MIEKTNQCLNYPVTMAATREGHIPREMGGAPNQIPGTVMNISKWKPKSRLKIGILSILSILSI